MLEIVLTREDANTEYALLAEWLVEDRAEVTHGQPVCVVETTKATVEIEAPGAGTIVQLFGEEVEVELGKVIAYVAESAGELASLDAGVTVKTAPKPVEGDRKATKKALELAALHDVDVSAIEKRGFITEKDVEEDIARRKASEAPAPEPVIAGLSTEGVSLPATFDPDGTDGSLDAAFLEPLRSDPDAFRALRPADKVRVLREGGARIGEGVDLGEGSLVLAPRVVIEDGVRLGPRATLVCEEVVPTSTSRWSLVSQAGGIVSEGTNGIRPSPPADVTVSDAPKTCAFVVAPTAIDSGAVAGDPAVPSPKKSRSFPAEITATTPARTTFATAGTSASVRGSACGPPPEKLITSIPSRTAASNAATISGEFAEQHPPSGSGTLKTR